MNQRTRTVLPFPTLNLAIQRLFTIGLVLSAFTGEAPAQNTKLDTKTVRLENGQELQIKSIHPSRILPHAYYDQAMASIPGVYPNSQILAKRRLGYLMKSSSTLYSVVCYKESKDLEEVTISGVVINKTKAWSFDAKVHESSFVDTLVLILEALADLPLNKSLQP